MPIDYRKYPADWKAIRARILERARNSCEICGLPNGVTTTRNVSNPALILDYFSGLYDAADWGKPIKIILTIAHLDHDISNNDPTNLAALCQRCHLRHDREDNARRRADTLKRKKEKP